MSSGKWKDKEDRRIHPPLWDTEKEKIFIDGLGTHSFSRMSRLEMLRNYLDAINLPGPMKGMDKKYIKTYVKNSIAMEEKYPTEKRPRRIDVEQRLSGDMDDYINSDAETIVDTIERNTDEI